MKISIELEQELDGVNFYVDGHLAAFVVPFEKSEIDAEKVREWVESWLVQDEIDFKSPNYIVPKLLGEGFRK